MNIQAPVLHSMKVMDHTGHSTVTWDPTDTESVAAARREFRRLLQQGHAAFTMTPVVENGVIVEEKGAQIREFDPALGRILMVPGRQGG